MACYMVFIREGEIVDAEAMAKYRSGGGAGPNVGMKPLVVYGQLETVEGEPADGMVILEFPDREAAKTWYYSEEYQAKAQFRIAAAPYRAFIVDGFAPAAS